MRLFHSLPSLCRLHWQKQKGLSSAVVFFCIYRISTAGASHSTHCSQIACLPHVVQGGKKSLVIPLVTVVTLHLYCGCLFLLPLLGDAQFSEAVGYPMVQQWRVRSNLYKVKLSSITLSTGWTVCLFCFFSFVASHSTAH